MDTGGRPSELLALKISDLQIKTSSSTGKKYTEFWIGGKVGSKMKKAIPRIAECMKSMCMSWEIEGNRELLIARGIVDREETISSA